MRENNKEFSVAMRTSLAVSMASSENIPNSTPSKQGQSLYKQTLLTDNTAVKLLSRSCDRVPDKHKRSTSKSSVWEKSKKDKRKRRYHSSQGSSQRKSSLSQLDSNSTGGQHKSSCHNGGKHLTPSKPPKNGRRMISSSLTRPIDHSHKHNSYSSESESSECISPTSMTIKIPGSTILSSSQTRRSVFFPKCAGKVDDTTEEFMQSAEASLCSEPKSSSRLLPPVTEQDSTASPSTLSTTSPEFPLPSHFSTSVASVSAISSTSSSKLHCVSDFELSINSKSSYTTSVSCGTKNSKKLSGSNVFVAKSAELALSGISLLGESNSTSNPTTLNSISNPRKSSCSSSHSLGENTPSPLESSLPLLPIDYNLESITPPGSVSPPPPTTKLSSKANASPVACSFPDAKKSLTTHDPSFTRKSPLSLKKSIHSSKFITKKKSDLSVSRKLPLPSSSENLDNSSSCASGKAAAADKVETPAAAHEQVIFSLDDRLSNSNNRKRKRRRSKKMHVRRNPPNKSDHEVIVIDDDDDELPSKKNHPDDHVCIDLTEENTTPTLVLEVDEGASGSTTPSTTPLHCQDPDRTPELFQLRAITEHHQISANPRSTVKRALFDFPCNNDSFVQNPGATTPTLIQLKKANENTYEDVSSVEDGSRNALVYEEISSDDGLQKGKDKERMQSTIEATTPSDVIKSSSGKFNFSLDLDSANESDDVFSDDNRGRSHCDVESGGLRESSRTMQPASLGISSSGTILDSHALSPLEEEVVKAQVFAVVKSFVEMHRAYNSNLEQCQKSCSGVREQSFAVSEKEGVGCIPKLSDNGCVSNAAKQDSISMPPHFAIDMEHSWKRTPLGEVRTLMSHRRISHVLVQEKVQPLNRTQESTLVNKLEQDTRLLSQRLCFVAEYLKIFTTYNRMPNAKILCGVWDLLQKPLESDGSWLCPEAVSLCVLYLRDLLSLHPPGQHKFVDDQYSQFVGRLAAQGDMPYGLWEHIKSLMRSPATYSMATFLVDLLLADLWAVLSTNRSATPLFMGVFWTRPVGNVSMPIRQLLECTFQLMSSWTNSVEQICSLKNLMTLLFLASTVCVDLETELLIRLRQLPAHNQSYLVGQIYSISLRSKLTDGLPLVKKSHGIYHRFFDSDTGEFSRELTALRSHKRDDAAPTVPVLSHDSDCPIKVSKSGGFATEAPSPSPVTKCEEVARKSVSSLPTASRNEGSQKNKDLSLSVKSTPTKMQPKGLSFDSATPTAKNNCFQRCESLPLDRKGPRVVSVSSTPTNQESFSKHCLPGAKAPRFRAENQSLSTTTNFSNKSTDTKNNTVVSSATKVRSKSESHHKKVRQKAISSCPSTPTGRKVPCSNGFYSPHPPHPKQQSDTRAPKKLPSPNKDWDQALTMFEKHHTKLVGPQKRPLATRDHLPPSNKSPITHNPPWSHHARRPKHLISPTRPTPRRRQSEGNKVNPGTTNMRMAHAQKTSDSTKSGHRPSNQYFREMKSIPS